MATAETLKSALNRANPNTLADVLAKIDLGSILSPVSATVAQTAATTVTLDPPALSPATTTVRVTAGVSLGAYMVVDADGVAVNVGTEIGVCKLSADGATLTFASNVEGAKVTYLAAPAVALDSAWPSI